MGLSELLAVGAGGAFGAVARYLVGQALPNRSVPWSTLVVNVTGSFLLGLVTAVAANEALQLTLAVGVCGAFTTYSSFSFQTVTRWREGDRRLAVAYACGTLVLSLAAYALAWKLAVGLHGW